MFSALLTGMKTAVSDEEGCHQTDDAHDGHHAENAEVKHWLLQPHLASDEQCQGDYANG